MTGAPYRLTNRQAIKDMIEKAPSFTSQSLVVKFLPAESPQSSGPRFAVLVGTGLSKKAVTRNLLRRKIREAVRANLRLLKTRVDFVIIARRGITGREYRDLVYEIQGLFEKLNASSKQP